MQPIQSAKFLIGNRFHITLRILGPEICKQCSRSGEMMKG